jgi:hypothetical protein
MQHCPLWSQPAGQTQPVENGRQPGVFGQKPGAYSPEIAQKELDVQLAPSGSTQYTPLQMSGERHVGPPGEQAAPAI